MATLIATFRSGHEARLFLSVATKLAENSQSFHASYEPKGKTFIVSVESNDADLMRKISDALQTYRPLARKIIQ